jgi:hypothetical protein
VSPDHCLVIGFVVTRLRGTSTSMLHYPRLKGGIFRSSDVSHRSINCPILCHGKDVWRMGTWVEAVRSKPSSNAGHRPR